MLRMHNSDIFGFPTDTCEGTWCRRFISFLMIYRKKQVHLL